MRNRVIGVILGLFWVTGASAQAPAGSNPPDTKGKNVRIVYPKKTEMDFEGLDIRGQIRSPGEFYFQRRQEERFDSLVKPRKNFHREMLRDAVLSK